MTSLLRAPAAVARDLYAAYRASGATLPFGDPLRAHGVAMEGYFWRLSDAASGRALIALIGVNRDRSGSHWATLGLATHPSRVLVEVAAADVEAWADPDRLGARSGTAFDGTATTVHVDLGPGARLSVGVEDSALWPRPRFGGSSLFQSVPALNQYWHPWLLGGRAVGSAQVGEETWEIDGWQVYGEKNWGAEGFP